MKRLSTIFTSLFLSLAILWIGSGVSLVHCSHSGQTQIMQMGMMDSGDNGCCQPTKPCMSVTVVKLSPSVSAVSTSFDFHQLPVIVGDWLTTVDLRPLLSPTFLVPETVDSVWHGPPRVWLSLIRVLQI